MDSVQAAHPPDWVLTALALRKLDGTSAQAVEKHLARCADCRRRVAEIRARSGAGSGPDAPAADKSALGRSRKSEARSRAGRTDSEAPRASTLPPGLADHPDYEVTRELGRGGMGVVYLVHNKLMGRDEVLKVVGREVMESRGVLDRFLREIRVVAGLRHPNIVKAYHASRVGDSIVFAMEYVDGGDLSQMVRDQGPLPVSHACYYAYQAALALQHAHEEGLVHRDIKPGNLMITRAGGRPTVKVLDFGLAKATREQKVDTTVTSHGQALGTPDYMAPEQIIDATSADIRADIYSLGGTLYYLLTGRPPFEENSLFDTFQAHISRDADPLNLVRPEVPAGLAALVAKMMAKDPARRFQTPGEVARALAPFFAQGSMPTSVPPSQTSEVSPSAAAQTRGQTVKKRASRTSNSKDSVVRAQRPAEPVAEPRWETLIDISAEQNVLERPLLDAPPPRRLSKPALLVAAAVGAIALGAIVFSVARRENSETIARRNDQRIEPATKGPAREPGLPAKNKAPRSKQSQAPIRPSSEADEEPAPTTTPASPPAPSVTNSIGMKLTLIPAGAFLMGSLDGQGEKDEHPAHRVRISRPFLLGTYEVTQEQYEAVMGNNPSHFSAGGPGGDKVSSQSTGNHPVENVTWLQAIEFCNRMSEKEGIKPFYQVDGQSVQVLDWQGPGYRLPTEAEWEYACRANEMASWPYSFGDDAAALGSYAWSSASAGGRTHPVGQKRPNAFGLFDMHGNVWEWCWDIWFAEYYKQSPEADPVGPLNARWPEWKVLRGGGWSDGARDCRSARRYGDRLASRYFNVGFRVARRERASDAG